MSSGVDEQLPPEVPVLHARGEGRDVALQLYRGGEGGAQQLRGDADAGLDCGRFSKGNFCT